MLKILLCLKDLKILFWEDFILFSLYVDKELGDEELILIIFQFEYVKEVFELVNGDEVFELVSF